MKRPKDKLIAGIDLHSNNVMIDVINQDGKRVAHRKLDCDLKQVTEFLGPLKPQLQSMAVESTFNWYWRRRRQIEYLRATVSQRWGWTPSSTV
jgi:hypothetical protein